MYFVFERTEHYHRQTTLSPMGKKEGKEGVNTQNAGFLGVIPASDLN